MNEKINWHYPRIETAESILGLLGSGALQAITIFAPRNYGKTELVLNDIWPLAEENGYQVAYASFWLNKIQPEKVFLDMLRQPKSRLDYVKTRVGLPGNYIEAQTAVNVASSDDLLSDISQSFNQWIETHPRVLLLLDEVQTLANSAYVDFIACLRTLLDMHRSQVQVVFTGSSREGLIKLFKKHKAPLFNYAHQFDLPNLGSGYVQHQLEAFHQASGRSVNLAGALRVFSKLNFVPAHFHDLLIAMLISGENDIEQAYTSQMESSLLQQAQLSTWTDLGMLARYVLIWLAEHGSGLYQNEALAYFSERLGVPVTTGMLQHQVELLREKSIIESLSRGAYSFTDPAMRDFVLEQLHLE